MTLMVKFKFVPQLIGDQTMCKFLHIRKHNADGTIAGRGGVTVAYNSIGTDSFVYSIAQCHSNDNFCKHTGRAKAAGRLKSKNQYSVLSGFSDEQEFILALIQTYGD